MNFKELVEKLKEKKKKRDNECIYDILSYNESTDSFLLNRTKVDKSRVSPDAVPITGAKKHYCLACLTEPEPDPNGGNAITNYLWYESNSFSRALAGEWKQTTPIDWKKILIVSGIGIAALYIMMVSGFFG